MLRKLSNKEVKEIQLEIMDDIHNFCVSNNLRYTLGAGSLLGAMRHKGYIPWDDDIDILLPRPDYEKFLKSYKSDKDYYSLRHDRNDKYYVSAFAKVYDTRTIAKSGNIIDNRSVFVDVFPIDGMPDESEIEPYLKEVTKILEDLRKSGKYYKFTNSILQKINFFIKYLLKRLSVSRTEVLHRRLNQILSQYKFDSSEFAGVAVGTYGIKDIVTRDIFDSFELKRFEDRQFFCVSKADEYLTHIYGDWRTPPSKEKQVGEHFDEVFIEEK